MFTLFSAMLRLADGKSVTVTIFGHRRSLNRVIYGVLAVIAVLALMAGAPFDH